MLEKDLSDPESVTVNGGLHCILHYIFEHPHKIVREVACHTFRIIMSDIEDI